MILRRILAALAVACAVVMPAHAQKTKAALNAEIGVQFPDNTANQIAPLNLRAVTGDIVNSIMPMAPVVAGNLACFSGTTGLLNDCSVAPTSILFQETFPTLAAASAATIPGGISIVVTLGRVSAGDNGGASYTRITPTTAAAWRFQSADGQWWALANRIITPEMFGAVGDGATNDTAAFASIASWFSLVPNGVTINNKSGANYFIWPQSSGAPGNLMVISNITGLTWNFNGSQISTNQVFTNGPNFFQCSHCSGMIINDPNWVETAWSALNDTNDATFFNFSESAAPWSNNVLFFNWTQNGGRAGLIVAGNGALGGQAASFSIINAQFSNVYYPMNFQGAGSKFFARGINCNNVGRCYFPWNVSQHDVQLVGNGGANFNDVNIKVYAIPAATVGSTTTSSKGNEISDIKLVYRNTGRVNATASSSLIALSFQQLFAAPVVSGAVSNGGLVRLTVDSTANMATGQTWFVNSVGGITGTTNGNNWVVTVINATTVDLQASTFAGGYTSGGYLRVPAKMKNIDITMDVDSDANGQPNAVTTYKLNSDASSDTTTDNYSLENVGLHGTIKNYNSGLAAIDLLSNDFTNPGGGITVGSIGTWAGETIRNVQLRDLTVTGTSSSVLVTATNISSNLQFENFFATASTVPCTITGFTNANTRIKDTSCTGITDRQTVTVPNSSTSGDLVSFSDTTGRSFADSGAPFAQGTWTPTLVGSSTPGTGQTYSTQTGTYQKIGREVALHFSVVATSLGTAAGNMQIGGLPFTSASTAGIFGHCIIASYSLASNTAGSTGVNGSIGQSAVLMDLQTNANTVSGTVTVAQAGASAVFRGSCDYQSP